MISLTEPSQSEREEILGLGIAPGIWGDMRGVEKVAEKSLLAPTWDQGDGGLVSSRFRLAGVADLWSGKVRDARGVLDASQAEV